MKDLPAIKAPLTRAETLHLMKPVSERCALQAAQENDAMIALELEVLSIKVDRFGWAGLSEAMKDRLTTDWVDVLGKFDVKEVKRAIGECLAAKKKMPTEYEVADEVNKYRATALRRARADAEPIRAEPKPILSDVERADKRARADAILKKAGFGLLVKQGGS